MKHAERLMVGAAAALACALTMACQTGVTGPSLSASIETLSLRPTVDAPSAENICCCHVVGTVRNTAGLTEHIQLQFPARTASGDFGTAVVLERDVPSGAVRSFEAPGIFGPCSTFTAAQIRSAAVIRPIGLWEPPQ